MRRTVLALALTAIFFAEAVPLLLMPNAPHCACVVKSACCRLDVCPMEARRHRRRVTPSLEACPGGGNAPALPPFLGRTAVMRAAPVSFARIVEREPRVTLTQRAIERSRGVEEEPPKNAPSVSL